MIVKEFMLAMVANLKPEDIPETSKDRNQLARNLRQQAQAFARQVEQLNKRGKKKGEDDEEENGDDDD